MSHERFIAFFDILGFKNLVNGVDIDFLASRMDELMDIIKMTTSIRGLNNGGDEIKDKLLKHVQFSDSIVFYTDGLSEHEFFRIVFVSKLFIYFSLIRGLPMRGCISHGEFFIEDNVFFGKALIEAYEMGESQNWAGGFVSDNTMNYIGMKYPNVKERLIDKGFLIRMEVPFKDSTSGSRYIVNWANLRFDQKELQINSAGKIAAGFMLRDINRLEPIMDEDTGKVLMDYSSYPQDVKDKINFTIDFFRKASEINIVSWIKFETSES